MLKKRNLFQLILERSILVKKLLLCLTLIFISFTHLASFPHAYAAESREPAYAKWGKLAMQKTKEKYPKAAIYDYLHVKREQQGSMSKEIFKLWLNENNRKFTVTVSIEFNTSSEAVSKVNFKEE